MKKTIESLYKKKLSGIPIVMVTAYDFPTAVIEEDAGVDSILVGDSLGTNMLGYASEKEVTMADMLHHLKAVSRGVKEGYLIADMPYGTNDSPGQALENAGELVRAGAECVKIEGWKEKRAVAAYLTENKIAVCGHIGYNPQIHGAKPSTFGREADQALELIDAAQVLQEAGAVMIVLEKVPEEVASIISGRLTIPAIGIGCGRYCDGQVLVVNDLLGVTSQTFRHARRYLDYRNLALDALRRYASDVESKAFPSEENAWHIAPEELDKVRERMSRRQG